MKMKTFLDEIDPIDWESFQEACARAKAILYRIGADQTFLRELVDNITIEKGLLEKCERHELLDKLVLYDNLKRSMRLRLHISTPVHRDRPHDHRFSFASLILRGSYRHTFYESTVALQPVSTEQLSPMFISEEHRGSFYMLHHSVIHTTFTTPDTVSLFLRGPAVKEQSIILHPDTGEVVLRRGEHAETDQRRAQVAMSEEAFAELRTRLKLLDVI